MDQKITNMNLVIFDFVATLVHEKKKKKKIQETRFGLDEKFRDNKVPKMDKVEKDTRESKRTPAPFNVEETIDTKPYACEIHASKLNQWFQQK